MNNPSVTLDVLKYLVQNGADGSKLDEFGNNILMLYVLVAQLPSLETITFLLQIGSDIKHLNQAGWSVLHFAAANPQVQPQVIAFLIERGCTDVNLRTRAGETVIGLYLERALEF